MENYIVIILIIVFSILSAINKGKKKQAEEAEPETQSHPHRPSLIEQFFDDPLFNEDKPTSHTPKTTVPKMEKKKFHVPKPRTAPISSVSPSVRTTNTPSVQKETKANVRKSLRSDFSLKKAVIYSEILNRKY